MNKLIKILFLCLFWVSCNQEEESHNSREITHYYENGNIKFHGYYIDDKFKDDIPINIHTEFHENGNIKSKTVYKPGSDYGKQNLYDENGDIISEGFNLDKHLCQ